jgi:uncharacterized protein (TIGR02646 family)
MNEVKYLGKDMELVTEFNCQQDKSSSKWEDEKYSNVRKTIKDHYLKEQDYTCCFCKQRIVVKSNRAWDAEHLIPKFTHPAFMFEPKNLCISCPDCNNEKRDKGILDRENRVIFPVRSTAYKIVHPHFDKYEEHLTVLVEGKLYEWKTKKGKFTYRTYGLDRFMEDAGRDTSAESDSKVQKLMKSALVSSSNYESVEKELLEELILKYSSIIGNGESINAIRQLRK